jgi:hypothetical protein
MSSRVEIPEDLAATVMFESDRTCCLCRQPGRHVQIHHIDEDPSNNDRENLAVLCFQCHGEAHTKPAFGRSLNAETIRMYNDNWRRIIKVRLLPEAPSREGREYQLEVLAELNFAAHAWVATSFRLILPRHRDAIENLRSGGDRPYSGERWETYKPIFFEAVPAIISRLNGTLASHGNVVPDSLKLVIIRRIRDLNNAMGHYSHVPKAMVDDEGRQRAFSEAFTTLADALKSISDSIDQASRSLVAG